MMIIFVAFNASVILSSVVNWNYIGVEISIEFHVFECILTLGGPT